MLGVIEIHQPKSLEEALDLLQTYGEEATIYAGGTELLVVMKERLMHYPHLIDIKTVGGLDTITASDDVLTIGALATHREIERSSPVREHAPLLADLEATIANVRVRATGTLGGNLCFAEPHSDPATLLIAWDASVTLVSSRGTRHVHLADFFVGLLETDRQPDEIMTAITIPLPLPAASAYERFKTHERPTATVAVSLKMDDRTVADARIVVGSVAERPLRIASAEALLVGEEPAAAIRIEASAVAAREIEPTEDKFESVEYKRHLVGVLTGRALEQAASTARENHRG